MHHIWICIHLTDCSQRLRIICSPPLQFSSIFDVNCHLFIAHVSFPTSTVPRNPITWGQFGGDVRSNDVNTQSHDADNNQMSNDGGKHHLTGCKTCLVAGYLLLLPTFDKGDKRYPCKPLLVYVWSTIHGNPRGHYPSSLDSPLIISHFLEGGLALGEGTLKFRWTMDWFENIHPQTDIQKLPQVIILPCSKKRQQKCYLFSMQI